MNADNPYEAPQEAVATSIPTRPKLKRVGAGILIAGLAVLTYGATAFWLIQTLPPNNGATGRLPSLYVMGAGIVVAIFGLAACSMSTHKSNSEVPSSKGIPTSYGILVLLAIVIAFFVAVSRM